MLPFCHSCMFQSLVKFDCWWLLIVMYFHWWQTVTNKKFFGSKKSFTGRIWDLIWWWLPHCEEGSQQTSMLIHHCLRPTDLTIDLFQISQSGWGTTVKRLLVSGTKAWTDMKAHRRMPQRKRSCTPKSQGYTHHATSTGRCPRLICLIRFEDLYSHTIIQLAIPAGERES